MIEKNRVWLVKSNKKILGPYSTDEIEELIKRKQIYLLDELSQPNQRWKYLREILEFQEVIKQLQSEIQESVDLTRTQLSSEINKTELFENKSTETEIKETQNVTQIIDVEYSDQNENAITNENRIKSDYVFNHDPLIVESEKNKKNINLKIKKILMAVIIFVLGLLAITWSVYQFNERKAQDKYLQQMSISYKWNLPDEYLYHLKRLSKDFIFEKQINTQFINFWDIHEENQFLYISEDVKNEVISKIKQALVNNAITKLNDNDSYNLIKEYKTFLMSNFIKSIQAKNWPASSNYLSDLKNFYDEISKNYKQYDAIIKDNEFDVELKINELLLSVDQNGIDEKLLSNFLMLYENHRSPVLLKLVLNLYSQANLTDGFDLKLTSWSEKQAIISQDIDKFLLTRILIFPEFLIYKIDEMGSVKNLKQVNYYFNQLLDVIPNLSQVVDINYQFEQRWLNIQNLQFWLHLISDDLNQEELNLIKIKLSILQSSKEEINNQLAILSQQTQYLSFVEKIKLHSILSLNNFEELKAFLKTTQYDFFSLKDLLLITNEYMKNNLNLNSVDQIILKKISEKINEEENSYVKYWAEIVLKDNLKEKMSYIKTKSFYKENLRFNQYLNAVSEGLVRNVNDKN